MNFSLNLDFERMDIDPPPAAYPMDVDVEESAIPMEVVDIRNFAALPAEIIALIFSYLENSHIYNCVLTCRRIYQISQEMYGGKSLVYSLMNRQLNIASNLSKLPYINHAYQKYCALQLACLYGDYGIVVSIMGNPEVDISADNYGAFRAACREGHIDIVQLFLMDARLDLTICGTEAIEFAFHFNQPDILRNLLNNPKVIIDADDLNIHFVEAIQKGFTDIINLCLNDPRINPAAFENAAFKDASKKQSDILKLLARDPRVRNYRSPGTCRSPQICCAQSPKARVLFTR